MYTPALGELFTNTYETPIHKSVYVPDDQSGDDYVPVLSHGQYGVRTALYGKQYPGYY